MKHRVLLQNIGMCMLNGTLTGYAAYSMYLTTMNGGESLVNYTFILFSFFSSCIFFFAILFVNMHRIMKPLVFFACIIGFVSYIMLIVFVMGAFLFLAIFSVSYMFSLIYPALSNMTTFVYIQRKSIPNEQQIGFFEWLVLHDESILYRKIICITIGWSIILIINTIYNII